MNPAKEIIDVVLANDKEQIIEGIALHLYWGNCISNSHNAPHNGIRNFNRDCAKPLGYPGWDGRLWLRLRNKSSLSQMTGRYNLRTGTGGFGTYDGPWTDEYTEFYQNYLRKTKKYNQFRPKLYSWDVKVFEADFPEVADMHREQIAFDILEGKYKDTTEYKRKRIKHYHLWESLDLESCIVKAKRYEQEQNKSSSKAHQPV